MNILEYLKSKGYIPVKRGEVYQMICPFKDKHIDYQPSFTIYEKTNSFFCFGCQTGGGLKYLARLLGDPFPEEFIDTTEELRIKELNFKRSVHQKSISIINRIRRMRRWYKNQNKLNKYLEIALGGLNGNNTHSGPTHKIETR